MMTNNHISIDDCTEIVRKSWGGLTSCRIVGYRLEEIGGQPGYLAEYAHLIVTIEAQDGHTKELRYFAKSLPFGDPDLVSFVRDFGIFSKESNAYRELLARDDLIVMEDLMDSGYRSLPYRMHFDKQHILKVLDVLAQMHACSLDLEFNRIGEDRFEEKFATSIFETTFMEENTWFTAGLKTVQSVAMERSKYASNEIYRKRIESEMLNRMEDLYERCNSTNKFQSVLVHRDLWSNNIMFRFEEDPSKGIPNYEKPLDCVLLDFQMARYLPPAVDVLCAIHLLTSRTNRDRFYDTYIKYYHQVLTEKLSKLHLQIDSILPWNTFLESLDHYRLVGLVWSGVLLQFVNLPKGFLSDLHVNDPKGYHEFSNNNRKDVIINFMQNDSYYSDMLLECIEETLEYMFGFGAKDCP